MHAGALSRSPRPLSVQALVVLHVLLGVGAIGGGLTMIVDPSGGRMAMPLAVLDGTPFSSFLVPGLILFLVLGIVPALTAVALWFSPAASSFSVMVGSVKLPLALVASVSVGVALVIWIVVQGAMIGMASPLQWSYLVLGFVIVALSATTSARRHFARLEALHVDGDR